MYANDAFVLCGQPDGVLGIGMYVVHYPVGEALLRGVVDESGAVEHRGTGGSAYPDVVELVFGNAGNIVINKPLRPGEVFEGFTIEPTGPTSLCGQPDVAFAILKDMVYAAAAKSPGGGIVYKVVSLRGGRQKGKEGKQQDEVFCQVFFVGHGLMPRQRKGEKEYFLVWCGFDIGFKSMV